MAERLATPIDWKEESQRFDGVADLYDVYRPSYPPELIDSIITVSGIQPEERILEIGSGTGKATLLFAQRGLSILCLEPGQNLIEVATEKLKSYPQVSFERVRFEDWEASQGEFDMVISAQAFHWVPKEVRYAKAASVLKQQGHLALFWNMHPDTEGEIGCDLSQVYRKRVPELIKRNIPSEQLIQSRARSLSECGYFEEVVVRTYPWSARYKTKDYLGLLNTYSDHLRLSDQRRSVLFEEIAEVIEQHGGHIEKPYLAVLFMARKL
jgi:ubiquinone/menaquinone biosynthesis C-methylase UbiE